MREGSERCVRLTKFEYFAVQIYGKLQATVAGVTVHTSYLDDPESQSITQNNFLSTITLLYTTETGCLLYNSYRLFHVLYMYMQKIKA